MKLISLAVLGAAASAAALAADSGSQIPLGSVNDGEDKYLIELAPGETRWVTEDEKWTLKRAGYNFFDVTNEAEDDTYPNVYPKSTVQYPSELSHVDTVKPLASKLSKENMEKDLTHFTSFHTRYYKSQTGIESATWLFEQVHHALADSGAIEYGAKVDKFDHPWGQFSIIARIPGQTNHTVVIGAHQDSINLFLPSILAAPGADDDGSGTVTILEAMRVLLQSKQVVQGNATNTVEFHWYSAEEGGLLGSKAVFSQYKKDGRDVKAMLQQDMTGYVQGTLDAGEKESVGVITDFVDEGLTEFIKTVITAYCDIPYVLTKCGYACSDHASASRYGYPSAFVIESEFKHSDKKIHTTEDKIEYLSFDHMLQHAKMTLGLAYELAFADF
ncbi:hypothetical protein AJ80_09206 [Polytolypa hystricis UAMH7299]|uniref:Peptide hydrolase n=1 Tax=Polytolypa hystricis (strain UAMH7299) TaxID=1447883 RepID=A0A2B7WUS1_POLH7|nr:hypothetical protein AJ80_09206 [Polytolypa hystricis UAMH7299]